MPVSCIFEPGVLIVFMEGHYSTAELHVVVEDALTDPRFVPGSALLLDPSESLTEPDAAESVERAEWIAALFHRGLSGRCAFVVGKRAHRHGIAREVATYLDSLGIEADVFDDSRPALAWLRLGGPAARK